MGLLTTPTCQIFLSIARSSVHCMDGWIIHGFLITIHGSLSSIHGQRPRTALLSSKGDLVSYKPYSRSRKFLNLLGWFLIPSVLLDMDDHYGRIGDELISRYPINHIKESQTFWKARAWGVLLPTPYGRCLTKLRQKLIFGHSPKTLTVGVVRMRYP